MSISLMTEAWKLQGLTPTQKLVLLSLSDNANDQGECYPSIATIVMRTCLSERSVQGAIKALIGLGYVRSCARLGTSTIYMLTIGNEGAQPAQHPRKSRTPANAAPPAANALPANVAPPQQLHPTPAAAAPPPPQELHPTPAAAAPEPSFNRQLNRQLTVKRAAAPSVDLPDWLDAEAWARFDRFRKAKNGKAWTHDAKVLTIRELGKLREEGYSPVDVIDQSVQKGWTGVFPLKKWYLDAQSQSKGVSKHGNFAEQDYHAGIDEDGRF